MKNLISLIVSTTYDILNNNNLTCSNLVQKVCDVLVQADIAQKLTADGVYTGPDYFIKNQGLYYNLNNVNNKSLQNVLSYVIDFLPQQYQQHNLYKKFLSVYEQLILSIYSTGHIANTEVIEAQTKDYNLSYDNDHLPITTTKKCKEYLLENIIRKAVEHGHLDFAIFYHKKYSVMFHINPRAFFTQRGLFEQYQNLSIADLTYLKTICEFEKRQTYGKKTFLMARRTLLSLFDSLTKKEINLLNTFAQNNNIQINVQQTVLSAKQQLIESFDIDTVKSAYQTSKPILKLIKDSFIITLKDNNDARYHLSIFDREFSRIFLDLQNSYIASLNQIDDIFAERLTALTSKLSTEEQDRLLKEFCKSGIDWLNSYPTTASRNFEVESEMLFVQHNRYNQEFFKTALYETVRASKQIVNFESYYNALNQMPNVKKIIVGAQYRMEMFKNLQEIVDGDYTWIIASQTKLIERYLKLTILDKNLVVYKTQNRFITHEQLTASNNANIIDTEIGPIICGLQYHYYNAQTRSYRNSMPWFLKGYQNDRNTAVPFRPNNSASVTTNCPIYMSFTKGLRNGYFHVETIQDFNLAQQISAGISYWLACCVCYYGAVNDNR